MNRSAASSRDSPPRRFILLPEETADGLSSHPRIRRYQLTTVGLGVGRKRTARAGIVASSAGTAGEHRGIAGG